MDVNSTRDVLTVARERVVPQGATRHGLVVGIDKYRDARLQLRCARADAEAMYQLMVDPDCGMFPSQNVHLLLDADATRENVWRAFSTLSRAGARDTVWVFYAGHAAPEQSSVYWVLHDTNVDNLLGTGLKNDHIVDFLNEIRALRLLVFLDCCHAAATAIQKNRTRAVLRGDHILSSYDGRGRITIASSDGSEKSVELGDVGHGAFSFFLQQGLRGQADKDGDGVITVDELWNYLQHQVTDASQKAGNRQTPHFRGELTHGVALTLNPVAWDRRKRIADAVKCLIGFGQDRLSTDEAEFCFQLLGRRPQGELEEGICAEFENLISEKTGVPTFKRLIKAVMPGRSEHRTNQREVEEAKRLLEYGRDEDAISILHGIPELRRDDAVNALLEQALLHLQGARCEEAERLLELRRADEAVALLQQVPDAQQCGRTKELLEAAIRRREEIHADHCLEEAERLLRLGRFDEAIQLVLSIPENRRNERAEAVHAEASVRRQELLEAERQCRNEFAIVKGTVETLAQNGDYDSALATLDIFQTAVERCPVQTVRSECLSWVTNRRRECESAVFSQKAEAESLYQTAIGLRDDGAFWDLVSLLEHKSATGRDRRLTQLLDDARKRLERIDMLARFVRSGVMSPEAGSLLDALYEFQQCGSLPERHKQVYAWLANWARLTPELRRAVESYWGAGLLDFQPGDEKFEDLRVRLERVVKAETMWQTVQQTDDDAKNAIILEQIISLNPLHPRAHQYIKPLYGRRGWRVCQLRGHSQPLERVSFSADGHQLISRDMSGDVKVWCLKTKREITPTRRLDVRKTQMCVSPTGDYALTGFDTPTVVVWDCRSGAEIGWLEGHKGPILSLAFSPDGRLALSVAADSTIRVWDLDSQRQTRCFSHEGVAPFWASFSGDGTRIVSSGRGVVAVWRLEPEGLVFRLSVPREDDVLNCTSADGRFICWTDRSGLAVVDTQGAGELRRISRNVTAYCLSPQGTHVATGSEDNLVAVWKTESGEKLMELRGHRYRVNCVVYSPDGTRVVSGSDDETVRLWDISRGDEIRVFAGHQTSMWKKMSAKYGNVTALDFSPDGRFVASGSLDTTVQVWYAAL